MKHQDLGIDMEKILVVNGPSVGVDGENLESRLQVFKNKAASYHTISAVSGSGSVPGKGINLATGMRKLGEPEDANQSGRLVYVDYDFTKTYDLPFLAGRPFTAEISTDEQGVIINEEAVKVFDLGSPEDALQEKLIIQTNQNDTLQVIGVLKNFHWNSLKEANSPYLFAFKGERCPPYFSLKMNLSNIQETIAHIESTYESVFPGNPFNYFFLDDHFNQQYQSDLQFGNLFSAFSILAIFIACLGLFALVSFSAILRVKEIGIRKVFGASVGNLMILLSREYMILLCIAITLAVPAIIIGGKSWLNNYAYKVGMGVDLFLIPGLILVVISFLTVSYRTYAAASTNPAESLRTE